MRSEPSDAQNSEKSMKKILLVTLLAVLIVCSVVLTACNRDSDRIDKDSDIVSVAVTASDGYKFELNEEQIKLVADEILRAGEFESDQKVGLFGWEFEYDYKFVFKVRRKKFLFVHEEVTLSYALGTTKTRTDSSGTQGSWHYPEEWTNFSSMTGSRSIAESTEEGAAAVHELLEGIIASERQQTFDSMKAQFVSEGFTVTDFTGSELFGTYLPDGEYVAIAAQQGFRAEKESTAEIYRIYYTTVEKTKDVYGAYHGKNCRKKDAFVGLGVISNSDSILERLFAED